MWTPNLTNSLDTLNSFQMPVALDNAAYSDFCPNRYVEMIQKLKDVGLVIDWVSVPDVVGDAQQTQNLFFQWQPKLDIPLAYVGQDGCEDLEIPFSDIQCVFIGGTTEWKLSACAASVVYASKQHAKVVHMGRVNSDKRLAYAYNLGCDSTDGTGYVKFSKQRLLPALHFIDGLHRQASLF